ncbi:hypothetical protein CEXT_7951, partial [Caerostris extrusa]
TKQIEGKDRNISRFSSTIWGGFQQILFDQHATPQWRWQMASWQNQWVNQVSAGTKSVIMTVE